MRGLDALRTGWWPGTAALAAVLLTSLSFFGILGDGRWFPPAFLVAAVIAATGVLTRALRWWAVSTVAAQLVVLVIALVTLYSPSAPLGVVPSPSAIGDLGRVLGEAVELVRTGSPPVPADAPLRALLSLGVGLIALVVDVIAVGVGTPAVAGLVLLCVFATPASLSEELLPWWTFVAGATGFAMLILSKPHRGEPATPSPTGAARLSRGRHALVVTATSVVVALVAGWVCTGVGTRGELPGSSTTGFGAATEGIGLRPFTSLRGQLDRDHEVDLFRVRGLPEDAYLRAMTLRKFDPAKGWELDGLTQGVDASRPLPPPEATPPPAGRTAEVIVEPIGFRDPWLPVFGVPLRVSGMGPNWRYDPAAGILFTQQRQESRAYTENLVLPRPTPEQLRDSHGPQTVEPAYTDTRGIPPQVRTFAHERTAHAPTRFDKALTLTKLFTDPANGFRYTLDTAPPTSGDGLSDFLFRGKRGYCEQFASTLAVLLRSVDIPSRVAVGFTPGHREDDARVITTQDAHAWVEAFFPGVGWTVFDPTPLNDGRNTPAHEHGGPAPAPPPTPGQQPSEQPTTEPPAPETPPEDVPPPGTAPAEDGTGPVPALLVTLVLVLALAGTPWLARELRGRRRARLIEAGAAGAADLAWADVLDAAHDRGHQVDPGRTARGVADDLIDAHQLGRTGADGLHALVKACEQQWYGPPGRAVSPELAGAHRAVLDSFAHDAPLRIGQRFWPRSIVGHRALRQSWRTLRGLLKR